MVSPAHFINEHQHMFSGKNDPNEKQHQFKLLCYELSLVASNEVFGSVVDDNKDDHNNGH